MNRKFILRLFLLLLSSVSVFAQTVNVGDLLREFEANKVSAKGKYGTNPIEVKGIIQSIDFDFLGNPYIKITETGGVLEIIGVQFIFQKNEVGKLVGLAKGNEITLRGKFDSDLLSIIFKASSIIRYTAKLEPIQYERTFDARKLYELYQKNAVGADAAFRGKEVSITGCVVAIDSDMVSKTPYITLSGDGSEYVPVGIRCLFPGGETTVAKITKNATVTIVGTIGSYRINVELKNCKF